MLYSGGNSIQFWLNSFPLAAAAKCITSFLMEKTHIDLMWLMRFQVHVSVT